MNSTPGGATTDMTYSYGPARRLHQPAVHPATLTGLPANGNHVPGRRWLASGIADATRRGRRAEAVRGRLGKVGRGVKGRWLRQLNPVSPLPLGGAMVNIVITGGAGFLGSRLARELLAAGSLDVAGNGAQPLS